MTKRVENIPSDKKIVDRLTEIYKVFRQIKSNVSRGIIDKTIRLINFMEHCLKNHITIAEDVIYDIVRYVTKLEEYISSVNKNSNKVEVSIWIWITKVM